MTEVGETAIRVESLIEEANDFEKLCNCDLNSASSVIDEGDFFSVAIAIDIFLFNKIFVKIPQCALSFI